MKCPVCGFDSPRDGHFFGHQKKGEMVQRSRQIHGKWKLVWEVADNLVMFPLQAAPKKEKKMSHRRNSYEAEYDLPPANKVLRVNGKVVETAKAYGVRDANGTMTWLPKSQVTMKEKETLVEFSVPAWLADQRPTLVFSEEE